MVGTHLIANLLNYNQIDVSRLPENLNIFTAAGRNLPACAQRLLEAYPEFPGTFTLARALRPYPQYNNIR